MRIALCMWVLVAMAGATFPAVAAPNQTTFISQDGVTFEEGRIPLETPKESIANLWKDMTPQGFTQYPGPSKMREMLEGMPRVAKLMRMARQGTAAQKTALRAALVEYAENYVSKVPNGAGPFNEVSVLTSNSVGVVALPLVMAETGMEPRELLRWMARMNERMERTLAGKESPEKWVMMPQTVVLSMAADVVLRAKSDELKRRPYALAQEEKDALKPYLDLLAQWADTETRVAANAPTPESAESSVAEHRDRFAQGCAIPILRIAGKYAEVSKR